MSTIIPNFFSINGVIDTSKSVLENMNKIGEAVGCWITYDIHQGKWAVVINNTGSSVATFNDTNIIGGINLTSTSLTEVYNSVEITFPNKDLTDEPDVVKVSIPDASRYPNEPNNVLSISSELVNNPAQARLLASIQLKQSRIDKVISFTTDYSNIGLKAGDLISVTNTAYGFTSKVFRIITISEDDPDDGSLVVNITALEYDADVYSTAGLVYDYRSRSSGIVSNRNNAYLTASNNTATKNVIRNDFNTLLQLTPAAIAQGLNLYQSSGTWFIDFGGKTVSINATDVVISWTFPDGVDLDIRCRVVSPAVGQTTVDQYLGWTGDPTATNSTIVWPVGATTSSSGTAYLEWGGDNQGPGGDATKVESVRVDIDRLKAVFSTKRYFVIECRGNWFITRGTQAVSLTAKLYEGGTTTATGSPTYNFTNAGATKTKTLAGLSVFVDSKHGASVESDGFNGATALGDLMGYFIFDTQDNTAQFTLEIPPYALT
jgi:hypothetical protein